MSVNRAQPHVLVLPEDDANRQIAIGFQLQLDWSVQRRIQVLKPAGGWGRVLESFESDHVKEMDRNANRLIVLLIDFDGDPARLSAAKAKIPDRLANRVIVVGALDEPEALRTSGLGTFEKIGATIAKDCRDGSYPDFRTWGHLL